MKKRKGQAMLLVIVMGMVIAAAVLAILSKTTSDALVSKKASQRARMNALTATLKSFENSNGALANTRGKNTTTGANATKLGKCLAGQSCPVANATLDSNATFAQHYPLNFIDERNRIWAKTSATSTSIIYTNGVDICMSGTLPCTAATSDYPLSVEMRFEPAYPAGVATTTNPPEYRMIARIAPAYQTRGAREQPKIFVITLPANALKAANAFTGAGAMFAAGMNPEGNPVFAQNMHSPCPPACYLKAYSAFGQPLCVKVTTVTIHLPVIKPPPAASVVANCAPKDIKISSAQFGGTGYVSTANGCKVSGKKEYEYGEDNDEPDKDPLTCKPGYVYLTHTDNGQCDYESPAVYFPGADLVYDSKDHGDCKVTMTCIQYATCSVDCDRITFNEVPCPP